MKYININNFKYTYSNDNYIYVLIIKNNDVFIKRINNIERKIDNINIINNVVTIYSFNKNNKTYNTLSYSDKDEIVNDIYINIRNSIITGYLDIERLTLYIKRSYTNYKHSFESNNSKKTLKLELS